MGYYTDYTLTVSIPEEHRAMRACVHPISDNTAAYCPVCGSVVWISTQDAIMDYIVSHAEIRHAYESWSAVWYDHEKDMLEMSKRFPQVTFHLRGSGESRDDLWEKHFRNGKIQVCEAEITITPFDPEKLK